VVHVERRQRPTHHRHHHNGDATTSDGGRPSGSDQVESDEDYARRLQVCIVLLWYFYLWHNLCYQPLLLCGHAHVFMCVCFE